MWVDNEKELSVVHLALCLCCLGRIRTLTGGTRIRRATITPQGNLLVLGYQLSRCFRLTSAKVEVIFESAKLLGKIFQ